MLGSWQAPLFQIPTTVYTQIYRQGRSWTKEMAGPCGGATRTLPSPPNDCDHSSSANSLMLTAVSSRRAVLSLADHPFVRKHGHFDTCPLLYPRGAQPLTITEIKSNKFDVNALFNQRVPSIVIKASKRIRGEKVTRYATAEAWMDWKVTLTRATEPAR